MIKVLFISANPFEDFNLDEGMELKIIQTALRQSPFPDQFGITHRDDVEFPDLPNLLRQYNPDLIHLGVPSVPDQGLYFDDCKVGGMWGKFTEARSGTLLTRATIPNLANLFKRYAANVKCILFTTAVSVQDAQRLLQPANVVIGFDYFVDNKRAFAFAQGFYEVLFTGEGIKAAYDSGVYRLKQVPQKQLHRDPFLEHTGMNPSDILTLFLERDQIEIKSTSIQRESSQASNEVSTEIENIKRLITNHSRRLQKRQEQKALSGVTADPNILIEIEDIQQEIAALQLELERLQKT